MPPGEARRHRNPVELPRRRNRNSRTDRLPAGRGRAAVHVDIENPRSAEHAGATVEAVLRDWPDALPGVGRLRLYPPAAKAGLWRAWASRFPGIDARVRGVRRFARENSADIAFVADAVADFTTGVANHVAVVSNDSDFGALFLKIRELAHGAGRRERPQGSPRLRSRTGELRWVVSWPAAPDAEAAPGTAGGDRTDPPANAVIARWPLDGFRRAGSGSKTSATSSSAAVRTIPRHRPGAYAGRSSPVG